ncbi:hypothetical protein NV226_01140 [Mycoplasma iguanae]|uniref:Uncharacterized protein n=1 Tax=Mycoplasma iguanae TaxID=292461 RepID=A0ABY5RAU7_9MOLU|nr:hypothetical protein [Mycoplasma iguanae]UVD81894.1 hypothetical protein NV226_01140 [Mycoplasma iguanae]
MKYKNKIRKTMIKGLIPLTIFAASFGISSTVFINHFIKPKKIAPKTFNSETIQNQQLTKKNKNVIATLDGSSFIQNEGRILKKRNINGALELTITLQDSSDAVLSMANFEFLNQSYLALITKNAKLIIYNLANPKKAFKEYQIDQSINAFSKNKDFLILYSDQNSVNSYSKAQKLDFNNFQLSDLNIEKTAKNSELIIKNIFYIAPDVNLIAYIKPEMANLSTIANDTKFSEIQFDFVNNEMQIRKDAGIPNWTNQPIKFSKALAYNEINLSNKENSLDLLANIDLASVISLGEKIMVIKGNLSAEFFNTPPNKIIHEIIFQTSNAKVIFADDRNIYNFNYNTGFFRLTHNLDTFLDKNIQLKDINLVTIKNEEDPFLLLVNRENEDSLIYGISFERQVLLDDNLVFQININRRNFQINSATNIPLLASNLKTNNISITNITNERKRYLPTGKLKFVDLSLEPKAENSTAAVLVRLNSSAWYNSSLNVSSDFFIEINNFNSVAKEMGSMWIDQRAFSNFLNVSLVQMTPAYLKDLVKPLNLLPLENEYLKVNSIDYFVEYLSPNNDIITIGAFINFLDLLNNSIQTFKISQSYLANISTEKVFTIVGERINQADENNEENIIDIREAIADSEGRLPANLNNFLPSYFYRSISDKLDPTVEEINAFLLRFVKKISNLNVSITANADDRAGTLKLNFNLDDNVATQNGFFSSKSITFVNFNKISDFYVNFRGATENNADVVDISKINNPIFAEQSPFTLVTGFNLRDLFYNQWPFSITSDEKEAENIQNNIKALINTNLNLMNFNPEFETSSNTSIEAMLLSIKDGILKIKISYPAITSELSTALGLDLNKSKEVTFINLPKINEVFNITMDNEKVNEIIEKYDSEFTIDETKTKEIFEAMNINGYDKDQDLAFDLKWDGEILKINAKAKRNNFNSSGVNFLPVEYNLEMSWVAKNYPGHVKRIVSITVPILAISISLFITLIIIYKRKVKLRKYF